MQCDIWVGLPRGVARPLYLEWRTPAVIFEGGSRYPVDLVSTESAD